MANTLFVRDLCPLAPNNVNTMACLAIFGIGFDRTVGRLVSDPETDSHHGNTFTACFQMIVTFLISFVYKIFTHAIELLYDEKYCQYLSPYQKSSA